MIPLRKLVLLALPEFKNACSLPDIPILGVECDSRKVKPGFLFVAIRGISQDGNDFIKDAISRGAAAVAAEEKTDGPVPYVHAAEPRIALARLAGAFYGRPSEKLVCVGITGTNGKTTSSYLLEHLLKKENKKVGVLGTVNYRFNQKTLPATETTPGPLKIQEMLSEMARGRCGYVVMEVSSHALDQDRTEGVNFQSALFTNLTQDHLDYHETLEAYFGCKARLFLGLRPEATAVLNADDAWVMKLQKIISSKILTYGIHGAADFKAENIEGRRDQTVFDLKGFGKKIRFGIPLIGTHNLYNALGSLALFHSLGFDVQKAADHFHDFQGVPGRLEPVRAGQDFQVFIDFAHTPDGLENVLSCLKSYKSRRLILVFGCGGDRDRGKRPQMAQIASRNCDFVYVTSDNPRSEDPKDIAEEIRGGFPANFKNYRIILDRRKAVRQALLSARSGDVVLLAGKGHERNQWIGTESISYSEREEAERVLSGH